MTDTNTIESLEELAQLYPAPRPVSRNKVHDCLSADMQHWLRHAPFFVLASHAEQGIDCSPRGDAPGQAFRVLDANTLAIPDRHGNNRIDTLRNLLIDPRVGLVFFIPGIEQLLRIKGKASISIEPALLDMFTLDDKPPVTVMLVNITAAYVQNFRAVRSAHLWDADHQVDPATIPTAEQLLQKS